MTWLSRDTWGGDDENAYLAYYFYACVFIYLYKIKNYFLKWSIKMKVLQYKKNKQKFINIIETYIPTEIYNLKDILKKFELKNKEQITI